jgi:hypothetical protein
MLRVLRNERAVPKRQRLLRSHGAHPRRRDLVSRRTIQCVHKWVGEGAKQEPVDAATAAQIAIHIKRGVIDKRRDMNTRTQTELPVRRPAHAQVEPTGCRQHRVVDAFRVQPRSVHPPQQSIVCIHSLCLTYDAWVHRDGARRLPIGLARND